MGKSVPWWWEVKKKLTEVEESLLIEKLSNFPYTHIAMAVQTEPVVLIHATTDEMT